VFSSFPSFDFGVCDGVAHAVEVDEESAFVLCDEDDFVEDEDGVVVCDEISQGRFHG